jgi:hypothetical protein
MGLNTESAAETCHTPGTVCSGETEKCCTHLHLATTWNSLVDTQAPTGMKAGDMLQQYYKYKDYTCLPGCTETDSGQDSAPSDHYVWNWTLETCEE